MPIWFAIGLFGVAKYDAFYFASAAFWLAVMIFGAVAYRCPKCRESLFVSRWHKLRVGRPWASRRCAGCGTDLTIS